MCLFKNVLTEAPLEENSSVKDKTELHITEETDDDVLVHTPTTHTTEDLFTIIHRSHKYWFIIVIACWLISCNQP